jgi:DNA polymerase elongation subunit (family B)
MTNYYVFDIETVPLPDEQIKAFMPDFDPAEIKTGNLGPDKAAAKVEAERVKHQNRILERAALSPLTGKVAAIGILGPNAEAEELYLWSPEEELINWCFKRFCDDELGVWIGFNISQFDIPFLMRRAWALGITPPAGFTKGRYLSNWFIDLAEVWRGPSHEREHISLDKLGRFLGLGGKEKSGAAFAAMQYGDPDAAREYLRHDLGLTWAIAKRLGVTQRVCW